MSFHIFTGTAAPSITPTNVGDHFIDTTNDDTYISVGTASSADWKITNGVNTHDLGGSEHNADTLVNLNTKVSDATLDDSGDSRPPSGTAGGDLNGTYPNPSIDTVTVAKGGTGQITATEGFDALAPTTTKGDVIIHDGNDNIRVAVGANDTVLTADSAEASGVKWAAAGAAAKLAPLRFTPPSNEPPTANFATQDERNARPCLDFDDSTDESAIFSGELTDYAGGGLTVTIKWAATTATSGNVVLDASIERNDDAGLDADSDSFAAVNSVTDATSGTSGVYKYSTITFTDGADMDSAAAGEAFRIKITRDADNGSDTVSGDIELYWLTVEET